MNALQGAYSDACQSRKVKPNSQILAAFATDSHHHQLADAVDHDDDVNSSTTSALNLQRNFIGDVGLLCLVQVMHRLPHLRFLSLAGNGLTNFGVQCLCGALDRHCPQLTVLDLRYNAHLTRTAGQALLNTMGRKEAVVAVFLEGTRVTDYFLQRIQRRVQSHIQRTTSAFDEATRSFLATVEEGSAANLTARIFSVLPRAESILHQRRVIYNDSHDELFDVADLPDMDAAIPSPEEQPLPADDVVLHSVSPDFRQLTDEGYFTIVSMPRRGRTVFGMETPGERMPDPLHLSRVINEFEPKIIDLPVKFLFPGNIDYFPAVHAPDVMLAPAMPDGLVPLSSNPDPKTDAQSMFWNFFETADRSTSVTGGGQASPRGSSSATAAAVSGAATGHPTASDVNSLLIDDEKRRFGLCRVNDALLSGPCALRARHVTLEAQNALTLLPLSRLVNDPRWVPSQPTRGRQVEEYCRWKKLNYNVVSPERISTRSTVSREYYEHRYFDFSRVDSITTGSLNSRGNLLAVCTYDMSCKVWDTDTGARVLLLEGHEGHITDCHWNRPRDDRIITSSIDRTVRVWDVSTGTCQHILRGHNLEAVVLCVNHDGTMVVSGGLDELAILWDIATGCKIRVFSGHSAELVSIDFSSNGQIIATSAMDDTIHVWNAHTGDSLHTFTGHTGEITEICINSFANMVLSSSVDATCHLWDVNTGQHKVLRGHSREVLDCAFAPNGWICASASEDKTIRIWDVLSGGCLSMLMGHDSSVFHIWFHPSGRELLSGSLDATARVWDVGTGECRQVLKGHKGLVLSMFNADGTRIATVSKDNTGRMWRLEPERTSLLQQTALAICQHPVVYKDMIEKKDALPVHLVNLLLRTHQRLFQTEREAVRTATPFPTSDTPTTAHSAGGGTPYL